jgi:hypothetical protein
VITRLLIKCIETEQCSVVLEPYGAEHTLTVDDHLQLELESTDEGPLEIAYSQGCITVWLPTSIGSLRATDRLGNSVDFGLPL